MSIKKTIYLIRHGQTDFNKSNIIQGSGINSDLNETGRIQAELFFKKYKHVEFDNIITSELKRTIQSVEHFIKMGIPHIAMSELNEINWGEMEGVTVTSQIRKTFNEITSAWAQGRLDVAANNGETPQELFNRQKQALDYLLEIHSVQILISSHGRAMRSLLCLLTGTELNQMDKFPHSNLCLYILEQTEERKFKILAKNDTSHLGDWVTHYY